MKALTYDAWQAIGYQVKRGEKSQLVNGQRVFTRDQVEERDDFDRRNGIVREEE